jgi:DNA-binding CsgD family transcriptional regulator
MQLVEREVPLQELHRAWRDTAGGGGFVLVAGEAGIGKTALVQQFTQQATGSPRLLWGACDALFSPRPLGPWHDIAIQTEGPLLQAIHHEAQRPLVFSACLQELQRPPTLTVIEDIHWADEATLDLLKYLGRRIHLTRALLIVTYRDDELSPQHPLRLLLGDLATSPSLRRINLAPLSQQGVAQLAAGRTVDAAELHQQTGGNPFYVTEMLATGDEGIPATVRDAILARAARLTLSGRAVLNAAAVIGPRIEPWLLAEVTRAEADAVSESLHLGILQAQGDCLAFRHELARQAILDTMAPHQRTFLHRAVLDALKISPQGQNDLTRMAHHAEAAGDREAILTYAPDAAKSAERAGAFRAAATLWQLAIRYSDELPPEQQAVFHAALAATTRENPDRSQSIAAQRRAIELAQEGGDLLLAGNCMSLLSVLLLMEGEISEAVEAAEGALRLLEPLGPSAPLAGAHRTRAFLHLTHGEAQQAVARAQRCLELAAQLESTSLHIAAYHALGICSLPLNHDRGCEYLEKSLALLLEENAYWAAGSVYADLAMTYIDVYKLERAAELIEAGLRTTTEYDLDLSKLVLQAWQSILLIYRGRWDEAEAIAREVAARPEGMEVYRVASLVALARLRVRRGQPGARELLDEALERSLHINNLQRLGVVYIARAEMAWMAGDEAGARREASAIYEITIENRQPGFAAELTYWRWRAGEDVQTYEWMVQPFVLEIEGDWRGAAAAWEALGCPYEQARALAEGDQDAQLLALTNFEQLGAQPMVAYVREKLRQQGLQTIPRGPRSSTRENPFQLTNRQLEILALLTENLTNAQIASRLHISPKTVDHHVSAILSRLDVASREEAAALAREHPDF